MNVLISDISTNTKPRFIVLYRLPTTTYHLQYLLLSTIILQKVFLPKLSNALYQLIKTISLQNQLNRLRESDSVSFCLFEMTDSVYVKWLKHHYFVNIKCYHLNTSLISVVTRFYLLNILKTINIWYNLMYVYECIDVLVIK